MNMNSMQGKRFLGVGRSKDFVSKTQPGEVLIEEGAHVYAVNGETFFCKACDGCGCRSCKFSGEQKNRK